MTAQPELVPPDHVLVIFGANGDLSQRKLLPGLFHLHHERLMPPRWRLIGVARSAVSDDDFRELAHAAVQKRARCSLDQQEWEEFASRLSFVSTDVTTDDAAALSRAVASAEAEVGGEPSRLFYLATPPVSFDQITLALGRAGLTRRARVVYEKPFGWDTESFVKLDRIVRSVLDEEQIYCIDHFLGKESVQNILALRFANGMFEAMWNRAHIDHVQIDVPETLGVGSRVGFYEQTGALRDMLVTHLFQVLSVVAMEPPVHLESRPVINEKVKVFESMRELRPEDVVLGQVEGYRDLDGVPADSRTDTFVAARVFIDNWRWDGVPFFLRTGKRLAASRQVVTLAFRSPPATMFTGVPRGGLDRDHLSFELAGDQAIRLRFLAKEPGPSIRLGPAAMNFTYAASFASGLIDAYERLLHDALLGDRTLFTRPDGIKRTWEIVAAPLEAPPPVHPYLPGSWGPPAADDLIAPRRWHLPEEAARSTS